MNSASHETATASTMLERARQVLELTHREWRVHERAQRRVRPPNKPGSRAGSLHAGREHGTAAYG